MSPGSAKGCELRTLGAGAGAFFLLEGRVPSCHLERPFSMYTRSAAGTTLHMWGGKKETLPPYPGGNAAMTKLIKKHTHPKGAIAYKGWG
eukprot:scaffold47886_cov37-Tisochrysis_lutea.AAC.1